MHLCTHVPTSRIASLTRACCCHCPPAPGPTPAPAAAIPLAMPAVAAGVAANGACPTAPGEAKAVGSALLPSARSGAGEDICMEGARSGSAARPAAPPPICTPATELAKPPAAPFDSVRALMIASRLADPSKFLQSTHLQFSEQKMSAGVCVWGGGGGGVRGYVFAAVWVCVWWGGS
jgi:hypothetical protein